MSQTIYHFPPLPMAYKHLNRDERVLLAQYRKDGLSFGNIGKKLGRSKSSLIREYNRNACTGLGYIVDCAEYHRIHRRRVANQGKRRIESGSVLEQYIFDHLRARWSPEDIIMKLREWRQEDSTIARKTSQKASVKDKLLDKVYIFDEIPSICHKTIYSFIKEKHPEFLRYFSVLSHKKPRLKGAGKKQLITNRVWIEQRPAEADNRSEIGHWEGDTIVSSCRNKAMCTFADRFSGFFVVGKMENRTASEFNRVATSAMQSLPSQARKTCTNDNGPEFAEHTDLASALRLTMYFAHPYHSWERPVNERTNRELRRFFPKGTDFSEIEEWEIDWAVNLINHKPRKRLNYRTPYEVFHERLYGAL